MQQHDVIIVGGGVAGLVLAIDLLRAGLAVAVIESQEIRAPSEGRHVRVSAINLVSERILKQLGAWEIIDKNFASPFREIAVWDATGATAVDFNYREVGCSHLGHIIGNHALIDALLSVAKSYSRFHWLCPETLSAFDVQKDVVIVKLCDESAHQAKLLVAADGAKSWVRSSLKIPMKTVAYDQTAVVATVQSEIPHDFVARQRFLNTGPLAFLPLAEPNKSSIVWSTTPEHAAELVAADKHLFGQALTDAMLSRLGKITVVDCAQAFPLQMQHVNHYVHPRVALIGDAAHTIHPLAGQGMNLGILDAACLAQVITTARQSARDFGRLENLRRYERWRRGDNQLMIEAMAMFKQGFALENTLLQQLRNLSLQFTRKSTWLRKIFMHQAMGLRGELPLLASTNVIANEQ